MEGEVGRGQGWPKGPQGKKANGPDVHRGLFLRKKHVVQT